MFKWLQRELVVDSHHSWYTRVEVFSRTVDLKPLQLRYTQIVTGRATLVDAVLKFRQLDSGGLTRFEHTYVTVKIFSFGTSRGLRFKRLHIHRDYKC